MKDNALISTAARLASIPFHLFGRQQGALPPQKALILQPCCLSRVMLTTPLLSALSEAYPNAQFDWAVHESARPAVVSNPRVTELVDSGRVGLPDCTWGEMREFARRMEERGYDTCFIPNESSLLALVAWMAKIPQRIGLSGGGRGFSHTLAVRPAPELQNRGAIALSLAQALGAEAVGQTEFYPRDSDRARVTELLVEELEWLGDTPLVVMHPGGGDSPLGPNSEKRWPEERFALLGNHLLRKHRARLLLVGRDADNSIMQTIAGFISAPVANLAGRLSLGELGALCEMADLYVGNDTGPTHVAAAVGCPTLAIFGPTDPARSAPYAVKGRVITLSYEGAEPFSWDVALPPEEAMAAADLLLQKEPGAGEEGEGAAEEVGL